MPEWMGRLGGWGLPLLDMATLSQRFYPIPASYFIIRPRGVMHDRLENHHVARV